MKNLIFLFVIVLFFSCANKDTAGAAKAIEATTPQPVAVKTSAPVVAATVAKRDTTPVPKRRYIQDTSRPKNEIKADFPFDISMTLSNRDEVNSEKVLAKNGKPTVLLFWLTTCYPCRMELNAIKQKYAGWKEEADFNFAVISTDFQKNYERYIKRVAKEEWVWDTYHDTNREFRKVIPGALNGLPQTFVFDKDGQIVYHKRKYSSGDEDKLFDVVKGLATK